MKSNLKWCGLLALVVTLFYWKIVLTDQFSLLTQGESVNQGYTWYTFQVRMLRHGHLPMWDPFTLGGRSFVGEMDTGAFSPLNWLLALVPLNHHGLLSPRLYHEFFVFCHFLGALFMFALIRELGLGRFPAFLAGICFSLSGFVGQVPWPDRFTSVIWLPMLLLFLLRAFRALRAAEALLNAAAAGLFVALSILAGGLHIAIMQGLVLVSAIIYWAAHAKWLAAPPFLRNRHWVWTGVVVLAAVIVAGAAGAVQLLPSHEYAERSIRFLGMATVPSTEKIPLAYLNDEMYPQGLVSFVFFSAVSGNGEVWSPYIGIFPLMLALIGVWKAWSNSWVRYLTVLGGVFLVVVLGSFTPLRGVLYAIVPFLWLAREATRFIYLVQFALCVLVAFGCEALLRGAGTRAGEWRPAPALVKWVGITAAGLLCVSALIPHFELSVWTAYSLLLIMASCGLLHFALSRPVSHGALFLIVGLVFLDLGAFNWGARNNMEAAAAGSDYYTKLMSCEPACRFLKSRPGPFRVTVEGNVTPNIGDAFGVDTTIGMGATFDNGFLNLMSHTDLLNVKYRLKPGPANGAGAVYSDASWSVYENPNAYPRAWIVHSALARGDLKPAQAIDMHRTAVLDAAGQVDLAPEVAGDGGAVTFRSYEANRVQMKVNPKSAGLLVMSELFYPGWRASVNGKPTPIYSVDGGLRAIPIPQGESTVAMTYAPASIVAGGSLSLITFAFVLSVSFVFRREKRRDGRPAHALRDLRKAHIAVAAAKATGAGESHLL